MKSGRADKINELKGVGNAVVATPEEIQNINVPMKKGNLLYNAGTKELKVADGETPPSALPDHRHPFTHAALIHSHIFGTNEPWLMSNPRLWYVNDLPNHPELVVLDGSEITDDQAEFLSQVYPGTKILTEPLSNLTSNGFENDAVILSVDSFKGDFLGSRLFEEEITIDNLMKLVDQWLTNSSDITQEHSATITFKGGHSYRPTEYWVCPAAGTASELVKKRPTPKNWVFEGSNDQGASWTELDSHSDEPASNWNPLTMRFFSVNTLDSFSMLRLRITEWNEGDDVSLETGLRRFWVFGRKKNVFALPNIESPHADFAWVVPYQNLNVGLKHEDIGDLGTTSLLPNKLAPYRLITDGSAKSKETYDLLFAVLGHRYDKDAQISSLTASEGTITDTKWDADFSDPNLASFVEITMNTTGMLGKYTLNTAGYRIPSSWTIEGKNGDTWDTLQSFVGMSVETFQSTGGEFFIDTTTTDKEYQIIRINFLEWNEGEEPIGFADIHVFTHPVGQFYIPNRTVEGETSYIVSDNTAVDVTPEVIQRLQNNVIKLTQAVADLSNQVNDLDPSINSSGGE